MKDKLVKCGIGAAVVAVGVAVYDGVKAAVKAVLTKCKKASKKEAKD